MAKSVARRCRPARRPWWVTGQSWLRQQYHYSINTAISYNNSYKAIFNLWKRSYWFCFNWVRVWLKCHSYSTSQTTWIRSPCKESKNLISIFRIFSGYNRRSGMNYPFDYFSFKQKKTIETKNRIRIFLRWLNFNLKIG